MNCSIATALAGIVLAAHLLPAAAATDTAVTPPVLEVRILPGTDMSIVDNLVNVRLVKDQDVAVSAVDPEQMHALIGWLLKAARAHGMVDTGGAILQQIAALRDVRVGLVTVYTCESASNCAR
jgi:hypothetical protein